MNKTVMIRSVPSYHPELLQKTVEEFFTLFVPESALSPTTKVLIKPNLLAKHPPEHAVTTHPQVLLAVILACQARGIRNIVVADSAGGVYNTNQMRSLYKGCGLTDVCESLEGVTLYDECQTTSVSTINPVVVKEFDILNPILEADFIINLPKFKTHAMTGMTVGCKNMFGAVPGLVKSQFHFRFPDRERFGEMLVDLLGIITPDLTILDGILAMEGDGPAGGIPRELGVLMASCDTLNLDLAVADMMGLGPHRVPYLAAGHRRGLCDATFDSIHITGDIEVFSPIENWKLPASYLAGDGTQSFSGFVPKPFRKSAQKVEHALAPHPVIDKDLCIGCGKCLEICSKDTILLQNKKAKVVQKNCIRCFCCHEVCPVKAIDIKTSRFLQF
ncbi:MAG: DUF362 domain-containing protein [Eubacteriales bacterium]